MTAPGLLVVRRWRGGARAGRAGMILPDPIYLDIKITRSRATRLDVVRHREQVEGPQGTRAGSRTRRSTRRRARGQPGRRPRRRPPADARPRPAATTARLAPTRGGSSTTTSGRQGGLVDARSAPRRPGAPAPAAGRPGSPRRRRRPHGDPRRRRPDPRYRLPHTPAKSPTPAYRSTRCSPGLRLGQLHHRVDQGVRRLRDGPARSHRTTPATTVRPPGARSDSLPRAGPTCDRPARRSPATRSPTLPGHLATASSVISCDVDQRMRDDAVVDGDDLVRPVAHEPGPTRGVDGEPHPRAPPQPGERPGRRPAEAVDLTGPVDARPVDLARAASAARGRPAPSAGAARRRRRAGSRIRRSYRRTGTAASTRNGDGRRRPRRTSARR